MNWAGVGWMAGKIMEANRDGRKKVNGVAGNFIVHYTLDETDGTHVLAQDTYGPGKDHGSCGSCSLLRSEQMHKR